MQTDVILTKWKHFRNEINDHWTELDPNDLDQIRGRRDRLVMLLETRYGFARRRAEREVKRVIDEFETKLRKAV